MSDGPNERLEVQTAATTGSTEARAAQSVAMVSLNDLAVAITTLTSQNLKQLILASKGVDLGKVAGCGCDVGGDCGCFGSNCPCNKLHSDISDVVSIDMFLRQRESEILRLRQELQALELTDQQISRISSVDSEGRGRTGAG